MVKKTTKKKAVKKAVVRKAVKKVAAKKPVAKKKAVTTKKTAVKKTVAKKAVKKAAPKKLVTTAIKAAYKKTETLVYLAETTGVAKRDVVAVLESLENLMGRHLKKGSCQQFTLPGMMKCTVKAKPAKKARKGINPFTGEPTTFKAKPASRVVKVRPLKKVKEMAS